MSFRFAAALFVTLLVPSAAAQDGPSIGFVTDCNDDGYGERLYLETDFDDPNACPIFRDDDMGTFVRIDGLLKEVSAVSRREETVRDESSGVSREYQVAVFRPRDRSFEIETWTRYEPQGPTHAVVYGGFTVRKAGRTTSVRVAGTAGG